MRNKNEVRLNANPCLVDLHKECSLLDDTNLKNKSVLERVEALVKKLPPISLTALGGFPIVNIKGNLTWCGRQVSFERLKKHCLEALGESAVLTYTNRSKKSRKELGKLCKARQHFWGRNWINLTLTLSGFNPNVERSFSRDKRFFISWPVVHENTPYDANKLFSATGSLKDWSKFVKNSTDESFDMYTRQALSQAAEIINALL